jgi:signal transduction histidine kinase
VKSSKEPRERLKLALTVLWLVFTVTFAVWWFTLSMDHIAALAELQPERSQHWEGQKRMIFWEGLSWIVLLIIGGSALIALVQKERSRVATIRAFFASFSHEVKTSLASLRVQAESLQDDLADRGSPILDRLVADTVRLQLQLENSLFFASQNDLNLFVQPVNLGDLVARVGEQWPNMKITFEGEGRVRGDERAIRTILSNLVQNAYVHGKAKSVRFVANERDGRVEVSVTDDGAGFDGNRLELGQLFHRPKQNSGSGLGLHISRLLVERMGGHAEYGSSESRTGFSVRFDLPGAKS